MSVVTSLTAPNLDPENDARTGPDLMISEKPTIPCFEKESILPSKRKFSTTMRVLRVFLGLFAFSISGIANTPLQNVSGRVDQEGSRVLSNFGFEDFGYPIFLIKESDFAESRFPLVT
jgi:hypothetical protein